MLCIVLRSRSRSRESARERESERARSEGRQLADGGYWWGVAGEKGGEELRAQRRRRRRRRSALCFGAPPDVVCVGAALAVAAQNQTHCGAVQFEVLTHDTERYAGKCVVLLLVLLLMQLGRRVCFGRLKSGHCAAAQVLVTGRGPTAGLLLQLRQLHFGLVSAGALACCWVALARAGSARPSSGTPFAS
jgi:hypothetical protein